MNGSKSTAKISIKKMIENPAIPKAISAPIHVAKKIVKPKEMISLKKVPLKMKAQSEKDENQLSDSDNSSICICYESWNDNNDISNPAKNQKTQDNEKYVKDFRKIKTADGNLDFMRKYEDSMKYSKGIQIGRQVSNSVEPHYFIERIAENFEEFSNNSETTSEINYNSDTSGYYLYNETQKSIKIKRTKRVVKEVVLPKVSNNTDNESNEIVSNNKFCFPTEIGTTKFGFDSRPLTPNVKSQIPITIQTHEFGFPNARKAANPKFINELLNRSISSAKRKINYSTQQKELPSFKEIQLALENMEKVVSKHSNVDTNQNEWRVFKKSPEKPLEFIASTGIIDPSKISTPLNKNVDLQRLPGHKPRFKQIASFSSRSENITITLVRAERPAAGKVENSQIQVIYIDLIERNYTNKEFYPFQKSLKSTNLF